MGDLRGRTARSPTCRLTSHSGLALIIVWGKEQELNADQPWICGLLHAVAAWKLPAATVATDPPTQSRPSGSGLTRIVLGLPVYWPW